MFTRKYIQQIIGFGDKRASLDSQTRDFLRKRGPSITTWLRRTARLSLWVIGVAAFGTLVNIAAAYLYLNPKLPAAQSYRDYKLETPLRIFSNDGALIAEFGTRRLIPIALGDVPQAYIDGLIATEDKRFYSHEGIDWISLANDFVAVMLNPDVRRGASTLTMQLPRNVADLSREQTLIRKAKEMLLAIKIERELTKDEILELYINVVPFGKRAYGLQAAAYTYYNKPADELNLAQLAMLAGIPKRPEAGNPINGPEWALQRRNLVLRRMLSENYISEAQYTHAASQPITATVFDRELDLPAPYPSEIVRQQLLERFGNRIYSGFKVYTTISAQQQRVAQRALRDGLQTYDERRGYRGPEGNLDTDSDAYAEQLRTLSDVDQQRVAVVVRLETDSIIAERRDESFIKIPWEGIRWARKYLGPGAVSRRPRTADEVVAIGDIIRVRREDDIWMLSQLPEVTGALVALNPQTGGVSAMVGGYSFAASQFNSATQSQRQPGSGIKPFVYSAALDAGRTAATIYLDAPLVFDDESLETVYRPQNDGGEYRGHIRLREALYRSVNLVSMRVFMDVGSLKIIEYLTRFGFDPEKLPDDTQLAIGGGTMTATPLEMATAYSILANGGYKVEPHLITKVVDLEDAIVYQPVFPEVCSECPDVLDNEGPLTGLTASVEPTIDEGQYVIRPAQRVIDERNIFIMNTMLRDVMKKGTGRRALALNRDDLAGKTGTTDDATDIWFSGFQPQLVASVWVGFPEVRSLGKREYGSTYPLTIWMEFMREALKDLPNEPLHPPEGVVQVRIDPKTGKVANPDQDNVMLEYFRAENSPALNADHRKSSDGLQPEDIF